VYIRYISMIYIGGIHIMPTLIQREAGKNGAG